MIEAFTLATAHHFGDALASQARLRYKMFVTHRGLPHNHYAGLEYDEFDTPAAVYFVWRDRNFTVRGVARLLPTSRPYMMQTYWPELADGCPPSAPDIWELTRVCIDRSFPAALRLRIFPEISAGVDEYCAMEGIEAVIGVTTPHFVKHHASSGFRCLGQPALVEGKIERAFLMPKGHIRMHETCAKLAIPESVLRIAPNEYAIAA
jgi:N-acyl-L-homoserine lactone synthetase